MGLEYLLRSGNRTAVLLALQQEQPLDRTDLGRRLDASRRTVTRVLSELTDEGYIEKSGAGYRLTAFGRVVADAYRRCKERTDIAAQYRPFLAHVDSGRVDLDPELLRGADLTVATDVNPYAPFDRSLEVRRQLSWFRVVTPFFEKQSMELFIDRLRDDDPVEFEMIVPAEFYEQVQSQPEYSELFRTVAAASVGTCIYPGSVSLLYGVGDDIAVLGVSVDGKPHAFLESEKPELQEWVDTRIDEFRAEAIPIQEYGE